MLLFFIEGKKHDAYAQRFWTITRSWTVCIFNNRNSNVHLWRSFLRLRIHLQGPFRDAILTPQKELYNYSMSSVRTSVEWLFGDIQNYFKFIDFKKNLKVGLSSVDKMYVVSALLRNALTCLYGNETSEYFQLDPQSLQDYFI